MASRIRAYYRKHDDYQRYLVTHKRRVKELTRFFSENRPFLGHSLLDVAFGGGVLGFIAEARGRRYVGIDINSDAISGARRYADSVGSNNKFILGDARRVKIGGVFDTVTLLGNALCHFSTAEFARILRNLQRNVRTGSYFIVDYRDVVQILFRREWKRRFAERREGKQMKSITKRCDTIKGEFVIDSLDGRGRKQLEFTHAVWSPFIIEPIMGSSGWSLLRRMSDRKGILWVDVYRKN